MYRHGFAVVAWVVSGCTYTPLGSLTVPFTGEVWLDRPTGVLADGADVATVTAVLKDHAGNALPDHELTIHADAAGEDVDLHQSETTTDHAGKVRAVVSSMTPGDVVVSAVVQEPAGSARTLPGRERVRFVATREQTVRFASVPSHYQVEAQPSALAAGDLNADGRLDVMNANVGSASFSVGLTQRDGTASAAAPVPLPGTPRAVALADIDQDGHLDALFALSDHDAVVVAFGRGDGTFEEALLSIATGSFPRALAVVDLNEDGHHDIVVANGNDAFLSVCFGSSEGSFAETVPVATSASAIALAAGDIDGDGHVDLAVAHQALSTVAILQGDGLGGLTQQQVMDVMAPTAVALADLDADERLDVVVASGTADVRVLMATATAFGFEPHQTLSSAGPRELTVGDFNLDGRLDVAVANALADTDTDTGSLSVLLGAGDGTFDGRAELYGSHGAVSVVAADLNGDAAPDLVAASAALGTVTLFHNVSARRSR